MKSAPQKTIHLRLRFSNRSLAQPALEELSGNPELTVTLLRGRIDPRAASFDLRITGPAEQIRGMLRRSETWGASACISSSGVA